MPQRTMARSSLLLLLLLAIGGCCSGLAVKKTLPERVIVGYASRCGDGSVKRAVEDGVNVVIWSFCNLSPTSHHYFMNMRSSLRGLEVLPTIHTELDLECIRQEIQVLEKDYADVVHLVSFGGWNGGHLDVDYSSRQIYEAWKQFGGDIFHGMDWDLEGNNNVESPNNFFTLDTLDRMGQVSQLAKDGTCL